MASSGKSKRSRTAEGGAGAPFAGGGDRSGRPRSRLGARHRASPRSLSVRSAFDLSAHVAERLKPVVRRGDRLLLGLSGGLDSIVLLDILARLAGRRGFALQALHVNHQLSPLAGGWARFCRNTCRARGLSCRVVEVEVKRGDSTERAARDARYAALARADADFVVLAHNEDDQAETVLLQLLRGAGVKGLAAMPFLKAGQPPLLRPLLDVPRGDIEAYARSRKLAWIEDESNDDTRYTRNWLRHEVLPGIARRVPAYRSTLTRAAQNVAEAAVLLDELAVLDAGDALQTGRISVDVLRALTPARAKNVLRHMISAHGWSAPSAARLSEALRQALVAKGDARVSVTLGDCDLKRHRAFIHVLAARGDNKDNAAVTWQGEREVALPDGGVLAMRRGRGTGLSAAQLASGVVTIRLRQGGEKLKTAPDRPRRTLKNLLQEFGVPPWERERLPLLYCGEVLACVPGIGIDPAFRARAGEASIRPEWRP